MIDGLIEALQEAGLVLSDQDLAAFSDAQSLLHDEDIADALWLAAHIGERTETAEVQQSGEQIGETQPSLPVEEISGEVEAVRPSPSPVVPAYVQESYQSEDTGEIETPESGLPLQIQTAPALPNARGIGRSLRPLMRKAPSRTQQVLDEMATVDRIAQEDIWIPVLKPTPERWFDLELVIEASPFEFVWEATLDEFQHLLEQQGAFRNVRTWSVKTTDGQRPQLFPKAQPQTGERPSDEPITALGRSEKELIDASGRALVLYVSDCRSSLWKAGEIHKWLQLWGQHQPTTVVQLLPERLWSETELNAGFKVQLSSFVPGVANPKLQMHNPPARRVPSAEKSLTLPVMTLTADALQQWAKVVAAVGQQRIPARLFDMDWLEDAYQDDVDWAVIEPQTPEERIELFNATASPSAKRLARLMSVVPVDLPVVHLLQNAFFREAAEPVQVAEVYNSCLMERTVSRRTDEAHRYEFIEGIRPLLNQANPIDETLDVLDVLSKEIARTLGFEINSFTALLYPRTDLGELERAAILPFAQIATQTLHRLGGQYAELAERVEADTAQRESWTPPEEAEEAPEPTYPELRPLEVIVAELIDAEDEPDTTNESSLELITDEFTIATITVESGPELADSDNGLEQFEFVVATLARREQEWVIQRQRQTSNRFVETLSVSAGPGFFRGVAQRLGLGGDTESSDIELEMVAIPGGAFMMGSPPGEPERFDREGPQHEVTVQPFFMGRYPITQAQWRFVADLEQVERKLEPDPSRFKGDDRPVEQVSWYQAVEFCNRLSNHTGQEYRLPSEAEWEYACRAGMTTPFHFGKIASTELANCGATPYNRGPRGQSRRETTPVGQFEVANAFGLSDMHGNVFEWCQDEYHDGYEGAPADGSAWGVGGEGEYAVLRGGSWINFPRSCRSACRINCLPVNRNGNIGFRVVSRAPRALQ